MALQGTLDTFSLPDVLRLLATTSKTGRLRIEGDRGRGSVWLTDGGVVDADADRTLDGTPLDEVVFELLRFESGSFAFDGDDTASEAGDPEDVEALLRRADGLLSEWGELEAVVPSLEEAFARAGVPAHGRHTQRKCARRCRPPRMRLTIGSKIRCLRHETSGLNPPPTSKSTCSG